MGPKYVLPHILNFKKDPTSWYRNDTINYTSSNKNRWKRIKQVYTCSIWCTYIMQLKSKINTQISCGVYSRCGHGLNPELTECQISVWHHSSLVLPILTEKTSQWLTSCSEINLPAVTHFTCPEHMVLSQTNLTAVETLQGSTSWQNTQENPGCLYYTAKPNPTVWYVNR